MKTFLQFVSWCKDYQVYDLYKDLVAKASCLTPEEYYNAFKEITFDMLSKALHPNQVPIKLLKLSIALKGWCFGYPVYKIDHEDVVVAVLIKDSKTTSYEIEEFKMNQLSADYFDDDEIAIYAMKKTHKLVKI